MVIFLSVLVCMSLMPMAGWAESGDVEINETNSPDANFRSYVTTEFDKNNDGILSQSELDAVKGIVVDEKGIESLKGIEYFTNLGFLSCADNYLTGIDVTKNFKLETFYCSDNNLTTLDVTNNSLLDYLNCSGNQLTTLDVSNNTKLEVLYCWENQLTTLDVSNNTKLERFWCEENQLGPLSSFRTRFLNQSYIGYAAH